MKFATLSVLAAGLCVLTGSIVIAQESGVGEVKKPEPPVLSSPNVPDPKKPVPASYADPAEAPKDDASAVAENGDAAPDFGDDPAALKRQVTLLTQRLATLERQMEALTKQARTNHEDYVKVLDETTKTVKVVQEGVVMMNAELTTMAVGMKELRAEVEKSATDRKVLGALVDQSQKQIDTLNGDLKKVQTELGNVSGNLSDTTRDLEIALSQVARWDAVAGKWIRVRDKAEMSVNGKRERAEFTPTTQGKLVIVNTDPKNERVLYINGTPWLTRVGRSFVWVPVGDVSISLDGDNPEFYRRWKLNDDSGLMELQVKF